MFTTIITGIFTALGGITSFKTIMQTVIGLWEADQKGRLRDDEAGVVKADQNVSTTEDVRKASEADEKLIRDL